jgi:hypothetical protein
LCFCHVWNVLFPSLDPLSLPWWRIILTFQGPAHVPLCCREALFVSSPISSRAVCLLLFVCTCIPCLLPSWQCGLVRVWWPWFPWQLLESGDPVCTLLSPQYSIKSWFTVNFDHGGKRACRGGLLLKVLFSHRYFDSFLAVK